MFLRIENDRKVYLFEEPTTVLVVDDDPIQREFAITELSGPTSRILCAGDGQEALEILSTRKVDLVLSDLHMPGLDGYGLLMSMRRDPRFVHTPLIMATTREDMFAVDRAYELGATSFVTKPLNWRLIGHQMRYVLRSTKAEGALRRAHEAAETAGVLRQNIMSLMSHETRTPLGIIIGFAGMIASEAHGAIARPEYKSYARNIVDSGERLFETLSSLQLFADVSTRGPEIEAEGHNLGELVRSALAEARLTAAERARVEIGAKVAGLDIACEARLIVAAMRELLRNAARHAGEGAAIRIDVFDLSEGIRAIGVSDNGPGISRETVARSGAPFLSEKGELLNHREGFHVGLPIARRVAELHGGRLDIASAPGGGARSMIVLPAPAWMPAQDSVRGAA